jgi:hypothetical protein
MVAVYNNERALDVVSLLSACQIVTLDIFLDDSLGKESAEYVLKYTVLSEYSEPEQEAIKKKINQGSSYFVKAVNEVNEFIKMKSDNNVKGFILTFDIRENKLKVNKVYKKTEETKEVSNDFHGLISKLETFVIEAGNQDKKLNAYIKVPNPNGKRPKYEQMTLKEIIDALKDMEM